MSGKNMSICRRVLMGSIAVVAVAAMTSGAVMASNLEYNPVSPTFGGNPNSAEWAKFNAHVQKRNPGAGAGGAGSIDLPDFKSLIDALDGLNTDLSNTTIIIPVF